MIVFRLSQEKYKEDLSGIGAELHGGRWNSKGRRLIYTGESRALCTTEIAVHTPLGIIPVNYFLQTIDIPDSEILELDKTKLDSNWKAFPHVNSTKLIGNNFIDNSHALILKVPSAVIQDDYNFLINPSHKNFKKVKMISVEEFGFDKRLFLR